MQYPRIIMGDSTGDCKSIIRNTHRMPGLDLTRLGTQISRGDSPLARLGMEVKLVNGSSYCPETIYTSTVFRISKPQFYYSYYYYHERQTVTWKRLRDSLSHDLPKRGWAEVRSLIAVFYDPLYEQRQT